ncbi:MAG: membrane protein insertion efficiency factor YidD [bacterium]
MKIISAMETAVKWILLHMISAYRGLVSPYLPRACRFNPSCSQYAIEAIKRYGVLRGCGLAVKRVLRCRPGGGSGFDPVP